MAPHDLIFIVGVLVFGLLEVAASIVTSWNDRPSSVGSWAGPASDGTPGSARSAAGTHWRADHPGA